jgi:16S rRNA (guanine1516-N2)-methyltransferase
MQRRYSTGNVGAKAAVKKETQILHRLLGDCEGLDESNSRALLNAALDMASSRVVVKRAIEATPLCGAPAHESITRSTHRCDLYFPQRAVHFPDLTL